MPSPALNVPSPALIVPLPVNKFPNKLAPKMSNKIPRNPPLCFYTSFLIASLTRFINKPDPSSELTIFIISFISSFKVASAVTCEAKSEGQSNPNILLWIAASVADGAVVNPNGIKILSDNDLSTFPIVGNPVFCNDPKSLHKNPSHCPILFS